MPLSTWNSYMPGPKIFDFFFDTGRWQNTPLEIGLKCLSWPEVFKTPPFFENHELRHTVRPQNVIFMKIAILWKNFFRNSKFFFQKKRLVLGYILVYLTYWSFYHTVCEVENRKQKFQVQKMGKFQKKIFWPPRWF